MAGCTGRRTASPSNASNKLQTYNLQPGRLPLAGLFHFPNPDMKTFVNKATGNRFPEHGCAHWFQVREKRCWKNGQAAVKTTLEIFERGTGWRKGKLKDWQQEEVADLAQGFTQAQWREYAATYGVLCAREFLPCCDLMKPTCAWQILHPPQAQPTPVARAWFESVFGRTRSHWLCRSSWRS